MMPFLFGIAAPRHGGCFWPQADSSLLLVQGIALLQSLGTFARTAKAFLATSKVFVLSVLGLIKAKNAARPNAKASAGVPSGAPRHQQLHHSHRHQGLILLMRLSRLAGRARRRHRAP